METLIVSICERFISVCYYVLFFVTPLLVCPWTYELFEFPKIMFVYLVTILIGFAFFVKTTYQRRAEKPGFLKLFWRGPLTLPLFVYLVTFLVSTIFSSHALTSIFGYYGRFHGGLLSLVCYIGLFFIFTVEYRGRQSMILRFFSCLLASGALVSLYALLQHWGIDNDYWIQDSARRVFSTLGQPNWLAAWLVMIIPLSWHFFFAAQRGWVVAGGWMLATVLFSALWFTRSLSGFLGFLLTLFVFFGWRFRVLLATSKSKIALLVVSYLLVVITMPGIFFTRLEQAWQSISRGVTNVVLAAESTPPSGPGDTVEIRRLVWQGALDLWLSNSKVTFIGTGPETFAYNFLHHRPAGLNKTFEWDFLYNRAHNEYLDILCEQGILGLLAYLLLLGTIIWYTVNCRKAQARALLSALVSGWLGLLVTNFFGFTVVPTALLFWLYPAMIVSLEE